MQTFGSFSPGVVRLLRWTLCIAWLSPTLALETGLQATEVSLDGEWFFALDPLRRGEQHGWNLPPAGWTGDKPLSLEGWDHVVAPHDYLSDPRYEWTGVAWYRRSAATPQLKKDEVCRLQFGRVASKCEVWINGKKAGMHAGGYSAFELDITNYLTTSEFNHIAVKVDNSWEIGDIPGPRKGDVPSHQMYVWRNYGGLLRSAKMVVSPAVYVANQKVETSKSSTTNGVDVTTTVLLRNGSKSNQSARVNVAVFRLGKNEKAAVPQLADATPVEVDIPAGGPLLPCSSRAFQKQRCGIGRWTRLTSTLAKQS